MKNMSGSAICFVAARTLTICFVAALALMGTAMGEISRTGLVGEWHFDGDAKDSSGNGIEGTIYDATFVDGKFGKALSFDGVNDYLDYGSTGIPIGSDPRTVEAWVKSSTNGPQIVADSGIFLKNQEFGLGYEIGGDYRGIWVDYGYGGCASGVYGSSGQWNYIAATFDGSNVKLFLNGNLIETSDSRCSGATLNTQNNHMHIGTRIDNSWWFNGQIDEVRIYNRALSAGEVKANYEAGQIIITSSPSGAEVLLDGQSKGSASPSLSVYGISPGSYSVKCRLPGYLDYNTKVVLTAGSAASVDCALDPAPTSTAPVPTTPALTTPTPIRTQITPTTEPSLSVSPESFSFDCGTMKAGESMSHLFSVSNAGSGTLVWSASDDQPWISINPTSGTNSGTVTLNIDTSGLSHGSHSGTITITSNGGTKKGRIILNIAAITTPVPTIQPPTVPPVQFLSIIGVMLVIAGLLFTSLTTIKKDIILEIGIAERHLKYVGGVGLLLVIIGAYVLLKSYNLI